MKPDSMIVESEHIVDARQDVATKGTTTALEEIGQTEPALASFTFESLAVIAGKLALSGASPPVVQGSHEDMLSTIATCVQALRRGHFELWKDMVTDTRLAQLDPTFRPKPRRTRKKPAGESAEPDSAP